MKLRTRTLAPALLMGILLAMAGPSRALPVTWGDDFEDGSIDAGLWVVGGARRGGGSFGAGSWQWSHEEVIAADGYLGAKIWGPPSGLTYGGDAWVRTTFDYNDGLTHLVNFLWSVETEGALNVNGFSVQVTDGTEYTGHDIKWPVPGRIVDPGWETIAFYGHVPDVSPTAWSVLVDGAAGTISVFDGPDGTGTSLGEVTYDPARSWYLRFVAMDGTASGLGAGSLEMRLHDFSSETVPEPGAGALVAAGLAIMAGSLALSRRRRRVTGENVA